MKTTILRYPDQKLGEFKALLQSELEEIQRESDSVKLRLDGLAQQADSNGGQSFGEDSKNHEMREMLTRSYERLFKKEHALRNALARIANKTYGVDQNTGELIDEARLRAVLTATTNI